MRGALEIEISVDIDGAATDGDRRRAVDLSGPSTCGRA